MTGLRTIPVETSMLSKFRHEWEPLAIKHRRGFDTDKIYVYIKTTKAKSQQVTISIGRDVSEILNYNKGDNLRILTDRHNPYLLKFEPSEEGYALSCPKHTTTLSLNFTLPINVKIEDTAKSMALDFELFDDKSFIVDLSSARPGRSRWKEVK